MCATVTFLNRLNMSSLTTNKAKTNMCFVSVKLFIVLTTFVPLFTLDYLNNNYNNNYLSDTIIRYSIHDSNCFVKTSHATCHKTA